MSGAAELGKKEHFGTSLRTGWVMEVACSASIHKPAGTAREDPRSPHSHPLTDTKASENTKENTWSAARVVPNLVVCNPTSGNNSRFTCSLFPTALETGNDYITDLIFFFFRQSLEIKKKKIRAESYFF